MMVKIILSIVVSLSLLGCTPQGPAKDWTGVARILPIIVTNSSGETRWTNEQIKSGFEGANKYWTSIGIQFKVSDPEKMSSDVHYNQDGISDFLGIMSKSKKIAKERHVYPVYFVDSIRWGDNTYSGMSTTANSPLGFQYGTIVSAIIRKRDGSTIAHELGHAWSLMHTWKDNLSDTPDVDSKKCNEFVKCNVMSYCHVTYPCGPTPYFTPKQIARARAWALSGSRFHLLETDTAVKQTIMPLDDKFEPILDPVIEE